MIELQKAKKPKDIERFRRYLGDNYLKKDILPCIAFHSHYAWLRRLCLTFASTIKKEKQTRR